MAKKSEVLPPIRVSPEEKEAIKKLAEKNKMSLSYYMVWMALNGKVTDKE